MKTLILTLLIFISSFQITAQFTQGGIFDLGMSPMEVADFDDDGDLDIFGRKAGFSNSSELRLLLNDGTADISFTVQILNLNIEAVGVHGSGDYDGDDDIDIVVASGSNFNIYVLENDGDANFTAVDLGVMGAEELQLRDLDDDGDMDILGINESENKFDIFVNDGNQNFSKVNITTAADDLESFDSGDIDGDGDVDVVLGFSESSGDQLVLFKNDGNNNFSSQVIGTDDFKNIEAVQIADIDNDGSLDILAVRHFSVEGWINQGNASFEHKNLAGYFQGSGGIYRNLIVGDYNGDNEIDIITGDNSKDIVWHKNIGATTFEGSVIGGVSPVFHFANGDLDNDGDIDLLVTNGQFWWYENELPQGVSTLDFSDIKLTVSPNPFQDSIKIENIEASKFQLEIVTLMGQQVFSEQVQSEIIDLTSLQSGVYFMSLKNIKTGELHSTQIVKMK